MKTKAEMNELSADVPGASGNTLEILDKVGYYSIDHAPIMPTFAIPENFRTEEGYQQRCTGKDLFDEFTQNESGNVMLSEEAAKDRMKRLGGYDKLYHVKLETNYLKKLTLNGAKKFYGDPLSPEVKKRLVLELRIMKTMSFPGYFLIVQDFIVARRNMGISIGPGHSSAVGSAVAYCLQIAKVNPIKYDLLFERFLNPDHISLPDTGIDFDDDGRGGMLHWVTEEYGQEKVAHIITCDAMATKLAIRDIAHVQKLPLAESDRLAKLVPNKTPDKKLNLKNTIEYVPELRAAKASPNPLIKDTTKYAKVLGGNVRETSVHACGTIIYRDNITGWMLVSTADNKETDEKMLVTQHEGSVIEDTGLIKMDFLGLKASSIIKGAVENIRLSKGMELDIDSISAEDPATHKLYSDGRTIDTFQLESAGMQKYLRELQPSTFEGLITMNVLYRPGPMGCIPDLIDRRRGREPIKCDILVMEKYLKDTYGITVYQEQVMLLSHLLTDFTRGGSDALCKAVDKEPRDKLDHMKPKFVEGGRKNGYDPKVLEKIWADWEKFVSYTFNKSHATCYSWVVYRTVYLKANYPAEHMTVVMNRSLSNTTDITKLMDEYKAVEVRVFGPDVNESSLKLTANRNGNIHFGLGTMKGVGETAVQSIAEERRENGPFKGVFDFVQRINLNACNKKDIECLALADGFDSFPELKHGQYSAVNAKGETFLEALMRYGNHYQADKATAANSLLRGDNVIGIATPETLPVERWNNLEGLSKERELVGIYLSVHPLDEYAIVLEHVCNARIIKLDDKAALAGREIAMGGIVTSMHRGINKNGSPYDVAKVEDYFGSTEIPFFGSDWVIFQGYLGEGIFLFTKARCQPKQWRPDEPDIKITSMELLPDVKEQLVEKITVLIPLTKLNPNLVTGLATLTEESPGGAELYFKVADTDGKMYVDLISRPVKLSVGRELISYLKERPELAFYIN